MHIKKRKEKKKTAILTSFLYHSFTITQHFKMIQSLFLNTELCKVPFFQITKSNTIKLIK